MGFSATAAHLILAVSIATTGAVGIVKMWDTSGDVDEATRTRETALVKKSHSSIDLDGTPFYQNGQDEYRFTLENTGHVVLDRDKAVFVVDGTVRNDDIWRIEIQGATSSTVWLPGDFLDVRIRNVERNPTSLWVVTEYGAVASYKS